MSGRILCPVLSCEPVHGNDVGCPRRLCNERFFVGLRLMAGSRPSPGEWHLFQQAIRRFVDAGLLETKDGVLRLTSRGMLLSNEVFQEFLTS